MSELFTQTHTRRFYENGDGSSPAKDAISVGNFTTDAARRLFQAIDEDDIADKHVELPQRIELACSKEKISANYALCLKYWEDGVIRRDLLKLINLQINHGSLSEAQQKEYKYIRSRYKHLRFALLLYSKKHRAPYLFRKTTVFLGRFQDAFRNNQPASIARYGKLLKILLSAPVWKMVNGSLHHIKRVSADNFITYRQAQMRTLKEMIAKPQLSGKAFHDVRKIISQQVSFYDTLRSINPEDKQAYQMSRFMAAINGMMGDRHDELVADDLAGVRAYSSTSTLDDDIRWRLELLLERYPL